MVNISVTYIDVNSIHIANNLILQVPSGICKVGAISNGRILVLFPGNQWRHIGKISVIELSFISFRDNF